MFADLGHFNVRAIQVINDFSQVWAIYFLNACTQKLSHGGNGFQQAVLVEKTILKSKILFHLLKEIVLSLKFKIAFYVASARYLWQSLIALQIGFSVVLFPSVLLAYIGQAAYLRVYPENVANTFYKSIPGKSI